MPMRLYDRNLSKRPKCRRLHACNAPENSTHVRLIVEPGIVRNLRQRTPCGRQRLCCALQPKAMHKFGDRAAEMTPELPGDINGMKTG
jgi:hypothetical protein